MTLYRFLIFFSLLLHISLAFDVGLFKPIHDAKVGLLDIITKPKIPKIPVIGVHVEKHIRPGSFGFGFGFGFGVQSTPSSGSEDNLPSKGKPDFSWEDEIKDDVGLKPHWEDDNKKTVGSKPKWEEDKIEKPKPKPYDYDKEDSKIESYEENKEDKKPDWEEIGEDDKDPRSEYLMDGELVKDGLIHPRNNRDRIKRFVDSKVYHVALKFISNGKPGSKVKIYNKLNSLEDEDSGM